MSYRVLIKELVRAGNERPELLYAIQELQWHFSDAKQYDLTSAKRLVLYLLGTFEKNLQLEVDDLFTTTEIVHPLEVHVTSSGTWTSTTDCLTNGGALWIEGFLLQAWSKTQSTVVR